MRNVAKRGRSQHERSERDEGLRRGGGVGLGMCDTVAGRYIRLLISDRKSRMRDSRSLVSERGGVSTRLSGGDKG